MSEVCRIANDPVAQALCEELETAHGYALANFDTGIASTEFVQAPGGPQPRRVQSQPDAQVSAPEVYSRVIELAERHHLTGLRLDFLRGRLEIPWLADDLNPQTNADERLRSTLSAQFGRIERVIRARGIAAGSHAYHVAFHRYLFAYMIRPRSEGGLGLRFDTQQGPPRTATDVFRNRRATCLDFVNFYLMATQAASIPAVPLELFENASGVQMHAAIGVMDPSTNQLQLVIDLMSPARVRAPRNGEVWSEVSRREQLSYFYNQRGIRNADVQAGEADIDLALSINPGNYLLLFNKAFYADRRSELTDARNLYLESIAANPTYAPAYFNLNSVALRLQETGLAQWAWQRYAAYTANR